jgi:hypothetical protein
MDSAYESLYSRLSISGIRDFELIFSAGIEL